MRTRIADQPMHGNEHDRTNMIHLYLIQTPIETFLPAAVDIPGCGACVDFVGVIRPEEDGVSIAGIEFEAYAGMAEKVMREKLEMLREKHGFLAAEVIHRYGKIDVGEAAIRVRIWAAHRREAYEANMEFMDELKKDVPIWKVATY